MTILTNPSRPPQQRPAEPPRRATVGADEIGGRLDMLPSVRGVNLLPAHGSLTYVLPQELLSGLLRALPSGTRIGQVHGRRRFGLDATYLDTAQLREFRRAIHRRAPRFEARVGCLCDTGACWLELTTYSRSGTVRSHRVRMDWDSMDADDGTGALRRQQAWLGARLSRIRQDARVAGQLHPQLNVTLARSALQLPDGEPVILDSDIVWRGRDGQTARLTHGIVVHLPAATGPVAEQIHRLGYRPLRCTLYELGTARLHPELAGQRWLRARHPQPLPGSMDQ